MERLWNSVAQLAFLEVSLEFLPAFVAMEEFHSKN
jgi:hypothetical protein